MIDINDLRENVDLYKKGTPIGEVDEMIAGICLANNASILTNNKKHFSKVKGLKVIYPL